MAPAAWRLRSAWQPKLGRHMKPWLCMVAVGCLLAPGVGGDTDPGAKGPIVSLAGLDAVAGAAACLAHELEGRPALPGAPREACLFNMGAGLQVFGRASAAVRGGDGGGGVNCLPG